MISHPLSIIFQRKGKAVGQLGDTGENEGHVAPRSNRRIGLGQGHAG